MLIPITFACNKRRPLFGKYGEHFVYAGSADWLLYFTVFKYITTNNFFQTFVLYKAATVRFLNVALKLSLICIQ